MIRPSTSPWCAPVVVMVPKPDGGWRLCVDYRKLNEVTVSDAYPLPRIDDTIDALGGSRVFSTMDLDKGYWQLRIAENSRQFTAFPTPRGLREYNVLPMGAKNAPAAFQRVMDQVLGDLRFKHSRVYLDDVIVHSGDWIEHLQDLEATLIKLRDANMTLKIEKCKFAEAQVKFLGHLVSADGVRPLPDKIQAVVDWPQPRSLTGLRSFLGLANYYRRFVDGYDCKTS